MGTCNLRLPWALMGAAAIEIQDALREAVRFPLAEVRARQQTDSQGNTEYVFVFMVPEAFSEQYQHELTVVLTAAAEAAVAEAKAILDNPNVAGYLSVADLALAGRQHEAAVKRAANPLPLDVFQLGGY